MCLPLCKASLLPANPMRLENAAARVQGRATRRAGKTYKAGALVGRDGTRLDDDRDRNTSISLGHFGTFLGWFYDILCGRKVLFFCIIDDQTLALLISSHGSDLLRRRCCSGLQVTSLQRLRNVLSVKLHKVAALCLVDRQGLRKSTKRNPAQHVTISSQRIASRLSCWGNL